MKSKRESFKAWVRRHPGMVRIAARTIKPFRAYTIKATGQRAVLHSYSNDGTITVQTVLVGDPVLVFGLKPSDLTRAIL